MGHIFGDVFGRIWGFLVDEINRCAFLIETLEVFVRYILDNALLILIEFNVDNFVETFRPLPVQLVIFVPDLK